ncbi:MAG: hypothetical protein JXR82_13645 [Marinifilaceae bacterium]|nr:hypothetical protein [Marinifilaceae bacterium]
MSEIELLAKAIQGLQKSNELLLTKFKPQPKKPVFITTDELKERWYCKYALIYSQMKKGLPSCKVSGTKMLFRLSVIEEWEKENF